MTQTTDNGFDYYDANQAGVSTGSSYADILNIDARRFKNFIITLVETGGSNSFYYKILASIKDGTTQPANTDASYIALRTDVSVSSSSSTYETLIAGWKWIIVQVKNNSGSATVTARARGTA